MRRRRRWILIVTAAGLTALAGAAVAVEALDGGGRAGDTLAETQAAAVTSESSVGAAEAPAARPVADLVVPGAEARVVQTASLALRVGKGRFEAAIDEARAVVAGLGGFVTQASSRQGRAGRPVRGTIVLRVPQAAYARALSALAALGEVAAREETGEDVSTQFVDLEARRRHLRAVEAQLLGFLAEATNVREALAVQARLDDVQLELEQVQGQLRYLEDRAALATIMLTVVERGVPVGAAPSDDRFGVGDAWRTAVHGLEAAASALIVGLVAGGPFVLALVLAALAGRALLKRRARRASESPETAQTATPPA